MEVGVLPRCNRHIFSPVMRVDGRLKLFFVLSFSGFMTFCPEWLTGNQFLDGSNFMYLWVYLVFFNMLWVFIPFYAIYVSWNAVDAAFKTQTTVQVVKKSK